MPPELLSILIVEDNAAARSSLCNLVEMGYPALTVRYAEDGHSGLECFKLHPPCIVITDILMPSMDGISMAAEMKAMNPEVAVIALTSYTDVGFLLRAIEIGIDHYLPKPVDCEKLYAAIDRIIKLISANSRRKRIEAALLKAQVELKLSNQLLEQRISERTGDLQAAIREQESFCYMVSHDLRAPLRHINSFSAILADEFGAEIPSEARDYLERIRAASSRMGTLIDHLLGLSRIGRARIKAEPVQLSEMAASILDTFHKSDPKRCVEIVVEKDITVLGDLSLLRQLLENLLGNAWKFTSRKGSACIKFGRSTAAGQPALFVKDDGVGFDMTHKDSLFVPFQQLHGTDFEGHGIGLATAQRIVHRHGGHIWAEGAVNQGAAFYFSLPVYL